jgi:hypothetical protein
MANGIMGVPAVVIWADLANPTFRISDTDTIAISSATISFLCHDLLPLALAPRG